MRLCCTTAVTVVWGMGWGITTATAKGCMHEMGVRRHHTITRVRLPRRMMMMMMMMMKEGRVLRVVGDLGG